MTVLKFNHVTRIVSGGQTGVDRAALDAALFHRIEHGGWCPLGRRSESGRIPDEYLLTETDSPNYQVRTEKNVLDSDGTLIVYRESLSRGTELTWKLARKHGRPLLAMDIAAWAQWDIETAAEHVEQIRTWIIGENIASLNVAGPRESSCPGIAIDATQLITMVLQP